VKDRIPTLKEKGLRLILFSGDTRGNAQRIAETLGIEFIHTNNGEGKRAAAEKLNPETCASIGNGLIDLKMMEVVKLGIVTLQAEGVHTKTLVAVDIVVPTINDALDLFIDESRLIGTLRI
jgi:soluble P-type ATPase